MRKKARFLLPIIRIGKKGVNQLQILEIRKLLKKKRVVKIKVLKSADLSKKDKIIEEVIQKTESQLINKIGNAFTIYKE